MNFLFWSIVVEIEERFLHSASRRVRRNEGEEKASACSGRNDRFLMVAELVKTKDFKLFR